MHCPFQCSDYKIVCLPSDRIFPSFMGIQPSNALILYIYNYNPFSANKGILVHLKEEKQLNCLVHLPDGLFGLDRVKVEPLAEEIFLFLIALKSHLCSLILKNDDVSEAPKPENKVAACSFSIFLSVV